MKVLLPLLFLFCSCAGAKEASRFVSDWQDARIDGEVSPTEMQMLDRDAEDLGSSIRSLPDHTGVPWMDLILGLAGLGATAVGTHKYTMKVRDAAKEETVVA